MTLLYPRKLLLGLIFLLSLQSVYGQKINERINQNLPQIQSTKHYTPLKVTSADESQHRISDDVLTKKQFLQADLQQIQTIKNNNSDYLQMSISIGEEDINLQLVKAKVLSDDIQVVASSDPNVKLDIDTGIHYWGVIEGAAYSLVTISFFDDEIGGIISYNNKRYVIGKVENSDYHILYNNKDLNGRPDFSCEAISDKSTSSLKTDIPHTEKSAAVNCVRIHVEADYSLYQDRGWSVTNTTNYIIGVFGEVATLYANESINIQVSYIRIWNTPSPYNSGSELGDLTAQGYGRTHGDLVHVVHANGGGGIAYIDVLCSQANNTGASGVSGYYNSVPAYSWDVEVITHELGHNLGSPHTHSCVWNGNNTQIDDCGNKYFDEDGDDDTDPQWCYNSNNQILPPSGGTIMSYCHLIGGVGINFNLGFGTQPGNLIRSRVNTANCLSSCGPATCSDGYQNGNETEIDCGGSDCIACPTCVDSIQNGGETGTDCGGIDCAACPCAGGIGVSLIIDPDYYADETTWRIRDASGNTVASGGPYSRGIDNAVEAACLPDGCYSFTIYDSYGDGLFDGNTTGTYALIDIDGNSLAAGGGNFGGQEATNFCVSSCADVNLSITFDGDPDQSSWEILDGAGSVVASGGNYNSQSPYSTINLNPAACLPDGCYDLVFYDSDDDGMCPTTTIVLTPISILGVSGWNGGLINGLPRVSSGGNFNSGSHSKTPICGSYTLTDVNNVRLAEGGDDFGSSETNSFCISGGVAQRIGQSSNVFSKQNKSLNDGAILRVLPTLVKDELSINYSLEMMTKAQINIVDINGKIMQQHLNESDIYDIQLNVNDLSAGIYFVQLIANETVLVQKFIKQ